MHAKTLALGAGAALLIALPAVGPAEEVKFPPELIHFTPPGEEAVFGGAGPGRWDHSIRERGWILREGDTYRMWYTGYDGTREGLKRLGLATSPDGVRWTRHPANPLSGDHWVEDVMVVKEGGTYYLFAEGKGDQAHLFTSKDGVSWERAGPLDVRLEGGKPIPEGPYGTPTVFREKGIWYLFYERGDRGVWLAASRDRKVWTNVRDEPVLTPGPAAYDKDLVALNQVIAHKGRYYAYYHGSARTGPAAGLWSTAVATSTDLVNWEKYPGNPLLPTRANKSSGILVPDGEGFRLYTMHPAVHLHVPRR